MRHQPAADHAGIAWTTWGNPGPCSEQAVIGLSRGRRLPRPQAIEANHAAMIMAERPKGMA